MQGISKISRREPEVMIEGRNARCTGVAIVQVDMKRVSGVVRSVLRIAALSIWLSFLYLRNALSLSSIAPVDDFVRELLLGFYLPFFAGTSVTLLCIYGGSSHHVCRVFLLWKSYQRQSRT